MVSALVGSSGGDPVQAPGVYEGVANVIAAVMLLLEFGMLRQALVRDQIRLYMGQSALISVLAIVIAADRNLPDLYALAALSAALKVVAVPLVMRRLLGRTESQEGEDAPGVHHRSRHPTPITLWRPRKLTACLENLNRKTEGEASG